MRLIPFAVAWALGPVSGEPGVLTDVDAIRQRLVETIHAVRSEIAKKSSVTPWEVDAKPVAEDPRVKDRFGGNDPMERVRQALALDPETFPPVRELKGFVKLDFEKTDLSGYACAAPDFLQRAKDRFISFKERFQGRRIVVKDIKVTRPGTQPAARPGLQPAPPGPSKVQYLAIGPGEESEVDKIVELNKTRGVEVEILATHGASWYLGPKGEIAIAIQGTPRTLEGISPIEISFFRVDSKTLNRLVDLASQRRAMMPPLKPVIVAIEGYSEP